MLDKERIMEVGQEMVQTMRGDKSGSEWFDSYAFMGLGSSQACLKKTSQIYCRKDPRFPKKTPKYILSERYATSSLRMEVV